VPTYSTPQISNLHIQHSFPFTTVSKQAHFLRVPQHILVYISRFLPLSELFFKSAGTKIKVNYDSFRTYIKHKRVQFNNCPTRCDLFSLLYLCRQFCMFRVLTPIIRSLYNSNYSFWYGLTGSTTIRSRC
jgi:hypothetical protein